MTQKIQEHLIRLRFLDPPADGEFGPQSKAALDNFRKLTGKDESALASCKEVIPLKLENNLASNLIRWHLENKLWFPVGDRRYIICYLEGASAEGKPNADALNQWNDRRLVVEITNDGIPRVVINHEATTEPGAFYVHNPINSKGAARIAFGQYCAWRLGIHGNSEPHEALVQAAPVKVYRDANRDGYRTGDAVDEGLFGINQHHGYDMAEVGKASAGCLVGRWRKHHQEFMEVLKKDARYVVSSNYTFWTTVIPGDLFFKSASA